MALVLYYNDTFFICHTHNYAAKFIYYGGQITYAIYIYIYILKIFYGVNRVGKSCDIS